MSNNSNGGEPDLGLLIKMLRMTTSDTDTMALVAIRKANKELEKFGGDWEALLLGKVKITIVSDPFANNSIPNVSSRERAQRATSTPPNYHPYPPPPPQRDAFQDLADAKVRAAQAEIERRRRVEQVQREAAERQRQQEQANRNAEEARLRRDRARVQAAQAFATGKKNKFAGNCRYCKRHLPAGDGDLVQVNGAWSVQCPPSLGCQPKPAPFKAGKKPTMDDLKNLI